MNASRSDNSASKPGNGSHSVSCNEFGSRNPFIRYCVPSGVFSFIAVLLFLTSPAYSQTSILNGEDIVQRVTLMVKPEVQNFAAIALGVTFAVLLVRSFK